MATGEGPSGKWTPDARTINWAFGTAHEDRVKDAIRLDVRDRGSGLDSNSDEYWTLVAEVAIEAILYDLARKAREQGTAFTRDTYFIAEDPEA